METVNLSINGRKVEAQAGATIFEAARAAAIYIPGLCQYQGLKPLPEVVPDMACQLCLVQADGELKLSCNTGVREGMRVETQAPRVREQLKRNLREIMRRYPEAPVTGELKTAIDYAGLEDYAVSIPKKLPVREDSPFFIRDHNRCILCERCVRVCRDIRGASVIEFAYPCLRACPAGIDIPRYLRLIGRGRPEAALAVIREKVPFPGSLGRVCVHPCEQACQRGKEVDKPLAIRMLKRYAADHGGDGWKQRQRRLPATSKRVAVIGAGPAGLTAAFYLAKLGHGVTVFEALPEAGGMMRVGIPEYRLPRDVLGAEIKDIQEVGVDIKLNTRIDDIDGLLKQGYDAVYVGVGAHGGMSLGVDGEDQPGVIDAAEFLRRANLGEKVAVGWSVGVVGGGNVAIDAARMSLRLGAEKVILFYRRTLKEMPANPEEVEAALEEKVEMLYLAAPTTVAREGDTLKLTCLRMQLGEPDESGRRRPEPIAGSEFDTELDTLIAAIGQRPQVPEGFGLETGRGNTVTVNEGRMCSRDGVFAGGDCVSGPDTVIAAIADGRRGAAAIDRYLGGKGDIGESLVSGAEATDFIEGDLPAEKEAVFSHLSPEESVKGFGEVEFGMTRPVAEAEAQRCLKCYVITPPGEQEMEEAACQFCGACVDACPTGAVLERSAAAAGEPEPERTVKTICSYCGVGCELEVAVAGEQIVSVRPSPDGAANLGQACVKGKFGQDFVRHPDRLTRPLVKKNGKLTEASWDEALSLIASKFATYRDDKIAVLSSAKCTNEDNYVIQKFTRAVLGTNNLDHCARL